MRLSLVKHLQENEINHQKLLVKRVGNLEKELVSKFEGLNKAVEKLRVDQELRIQLLEQATHNGILVWKIDEVNRRMDEAVKGITVSLFSAPFYSDPRGYKMCARYNT